MTATGIPLIKSHKVSRSLTMVLASVVLEWLLISMLFIDAIFSFLVTKFARYCELQVPCLLCSRLDHVLGNEKLGFYWDLICGNHKFEISSLVLCHLHNKLVDIHGMCESCLFSFATINKSNSEAYRLLVGKLGVDPDIRPDEDPLLGDHERGSSSTRNCSCCNESFLLRSHAQNLLQNMSIVSEVAELDAPLSVATEHHWNDLKKSRKESSRSLKAYHEEENGFDPLSHIEYAKVKINSDTESESPFSDDYDGSSLIRETVDLKEEISVQCLQMEPRIRSLPDDLASEKLIHPDSAPELPLLDSQVQLDVLGSHSNTSAASTAAIGHGLEELNWSVVEDKVDNSAASKFASVDEVPQSSAVMDTAVNELTMRLDVLRTGEVEQKCVTESEAGSRPITKSERSSETNPGTSDNNLQMHNSFDLGDAYKLAVSSKGRQLSGKFSEQRSLKDSARVSEDLKLLLSQISSTRGIELPLNDMSPRVSGHRDELKTDSSGSIGIQILQRRISLERNESGLSLDGSIVSEIDGENEVDRLKRQIDHDKKLMGALYKELEEERNASAVATNQAMAMITRLQEEKAALNMEASQCLRMMEEQAEYDVEALQKANDLIAEKEKELQDLEAELELYRTKIENASTLENKVNSTCDLKAGGVKSENLDAFLFKNSECVQTNFISDKLLSCNKVDETGTFGDDNTKRAKNLLLEFEDESLYVLRCLKKLEKKLHLFSDDGGYLEMDNGDYLGISNLKELNSKGYHGQEDIGKEENVPSMPKHVSASEESPCAEDPSFRNSKFASTMSSELDRSGPRYPGNCRPIDVLSLGDAVSCLISKLEALETDHYSHSFTSVRRGNDDLKIHSGEISSPVGATKDCELYIIPSQGADAMDSRS
ncbi:myosin-binding protein 1-like isoform X1 [Actinidia eriantha]|uniref:myosin-binding protein 1-like isoform X1 n=1 Tax=Actinidia eriantha TaxID=165200 RepID=UPI002587331D|nr:myosin-binding protein 1-like isoform X1 [Actinidia eriantha]